MSSLTFPLFCLPLDTEAYAAMQSRIEVERDEDEELNELDENGTPRETPYRPAFDCTLASSKQPIQRMTYADHHFFLWQACDSRHGTTPCSPRTPIGSTQERQQYTCLTTLLLISSGLIHRDGKHVPSHGSSSPARPHPPSRE